MSIRVDRHCVTDMWEVLHNLRQCSVLPSLFIETAQLECRTNQLLISSCCAVDLHLLPCCRVKALWQGGQPEGVRVDARRKRHPGSLHGPGLPGAGQRPPQKDAQHQGCQQRSRPAGCLFRALAPADAPQAAAETAGPHLQSQGVQAPCLTGLDCKCSLTQIGPGTAEQLGASPALVPG